MVKVAVSEAKGQLTELIRKAQEGEDVVLTRFGQPVVRLQPIPRRLSPAQRRVLLEELAAAGRNATPGPCAARSQDSLYDENGMPA